MTKTKSKAIIIWAIVGAIAGYLSANYSPLFGGFLVTSLAQPFSEARMNVAPHHIILFASVFGVIGFLKTKLKVKNGDKDKKRR